jgi:hypothetical protein
MRVFVVVSRERVTIHCCAIGPVRKFGECTNSRTEPQAPSGPRQGQQQLGFVGV